MRWKWSAYEAGHQMLRDVERMWTGYPAWIEPRGFSSAVDGPQAAYRLRTGCNPDLQAGQRVRGKPRSTCDVDGSGQREVTTFPRV